MTLSNPKKYYQEFLKGHEGKLHFAAHSHHFWPDVTRAAHLQYWDDCAHLSDHKWGKIFGEVIPNTQRHIAKILNLAHPEQIAIAPNTHELSTRLLSQFLGKSELRILTTKSEFHSWRRQFLRLEELPQVQVKQLETGDRQKFMEEFKTEVQNNYDVVFLSQVFFDSGLAFTDQELTSLVQATPAKTLFVIDGYHGFAAIPTDLSNLEGRVFYLGGGYKYGQGGEGVGFIVVPKGNWRPAYTGWFADQDNLSKPQGTNVGYPQDGMAFMGATQDPSGCYRFNAVWDLFKADGIQVSEIHAYVKALQLHFLQNLPANFLIKHSFKALYEPSLVYHGHFLTYEASSIEAAERFESDLKNQGIIIDRRGSRLRFGFGLYQDQEDVSKLCAHLSRLS